MKNFISSLETFKTLKEYENYLRAKNMASSTINDYLAAGEKFNKFIIKSSLNIGKLGISSVEAYLAKYRTSDLANNTYAKYVICIKLYLRFLYERNYIGNDLDSKIRHIKKIQSAEREVLKPDERIKIETYINSYKDSGIAKIRDLFIFYLLIDCGLRRNEVINLRHENVKTDSEGFHYIMILNSKGNKNRKVYINDNIFNFISLYRKKTGVYKAALIRGDFGRRITKGSLQNLWVKIKTGSKVNKNLTIHSLRHTYAERLRHNGTDFATISKLLGHSRLDTTMNYFHVNDDDLRQAIL
jgi:site-specific recombinase XerD